LIIILAQIGCYVPAQFASISVRDRILSRLGTSDDMEHNMSTFTTEMKEAAYIIDNVTDRSLTIIDELGRGTSNIDGTHNKYKILTFFSLV
jgi:DNA mismatch repair protein MSH4